jgi:hypothetical protein
MQGIGKSQNQSRADRAGARLGVTLAALLAIVLQALIVPGHMHALAPRAEAGYHGDAGGGGALATAADDQAACVICLAIASSGRAALPQAADIDVPQRALSERATIAIRQAPRVVAHPWRSRAPPIAL